MSKKPRLLDLFSCAGGAGMGYHRAGFEVVGIDIDPQPNYPFEFIQSDALEYCRQHWQEFDAIHASPPCQGHSVTKNMSGRENDGFLEATRELLQEIGLPYVIENTPGAEMFDYIKLRGDMFGLQVLRMRYFESNCIIIAPPMPKKVGRTSGNGKSYSTLDDAEFITVAGHNYRFSDGCRAMDIFWMTQSELSQSIPPAYTEYIGKQLIKYARARND